MVVIALHTDPMRFTPGHPLDGADAVLVAYADGALHVHGDVSLIDFTLPVRCALTRRVVEPWDDAERWARALPRHAHYRRSSLRATLVLDVRVPDVVAG